MSLTPGVRLGPYEVVAALGAGAMRDVSLALTEPFEVREVLRATRLFREDQIAETEIRHSDSCDASDDAARVRLVEGDAPRDGQHTDARVVADDCDGFVRDLVRVELRRESIRQFSQRVEEPGHVLRVGR